MTRFDVLVLTDLRFPGGSSTSLVEELLAARAADYCVGVLHLASPRLGPTASIHGRLQQLLDEGVAHLVLPGEAVRTPLTIVKHPMVFAASLGAALPVDTDTVIVTVGQVPADSAAVYYDTKVVDAHIAEALGRHPIWAPVSETVRSTLHGVSVADDDWTEIIDVDAWRRPVERGRFEVRPELENAGATDFTADADDRLVIGRHSRPDRLKWPDDADELRAVYPVDGSVRVRVLGGADAPGEVLGGVPEEWEVLPFGSVPSREFLRGLDAFVYYHHPDLIEAFGRTILEALAVGVPVVVPHHFRDTFGEACLYADPEHALTQLCALLDDPDEHRAHLERADRIVRSRFGHGVHRERLHRLVGAPSLRPIAPEARTVPSLTLAPPGLRASYTTTLVACLGASTEEVQTTLRSLDRQRRRAPGFIPIVVINANRPSLAAELGIETAVITNPKRWDDTVEPWTTYAMRRLRQLAAHHHVDNIVPADITNDYAWIPLQLRRSTR